MVPTRSSSPRQAPHRMLVTIATAILVAASLAIAPVASAAPPGPSGPPTGSCDLQSKGDKIQHVIYLQFDNVHFERDNPNVPSDIEQMPHLLQLPQGQRDVRHERPHDPDLAHGRRDPELADRPVSRPARAGGLELVRLLPAGRLGRLLVLVQVLDRQHRRRQPGEHPADAVCRHELQHGQRRPGLARRHRRRPQRAGAVGAVHARRLRRRQRRRGEHRAREQQRDRPARRRRPPRPSRPPRRPAPRTSRSPASPASRAARRSCSRTATRATSSRRSRPSARPAPAAPASTSRRRSRRRTPAARR